MIAMIEKNKTLSPARTPTIALLLLSLVGFSNCSAVPDEANPVEWYRGASGWFESDRDQAQRDQVTTAKETAPPLPGTDRPFPNLSTVPERPRSVSSAEERNRVQQGLAADRDNARYAKPEAGRPSGTEVGAPAAAPRVPVTTINMGPPSADTLEALPRDIAPPAPPPATEPTPLPPRSSLDDAASVAAAAVETVDSPRPLETPTIQPASHQIAADQGASSGMAGVLAAAGVSDAPPSPAPRVTSAPARPELAEINATAPVQGSTPDSRTSNMAVAQANPPAAGNQDLPRSFMVYFPGGGAALDNIDKQVLRDVARLQKSHGASLRIVGHASSATRETDAYKNQIVNVRISTQRAEAVASELARLGVPSDKMTIAGISDSEPLFAETTQSGIAGNRRVEIFFGP